MSCIDVLGSDTSPKYLLVAFFISGIEDYFERYGAGIASVVDTFGPSPSWSSTSETSRKMHEQMTKKIPLDKLEERRQWRNQCLAGLAKLKWDIQPELDDKDNDSETK